MLTAAMLKGMVLHSCLPYHKANAVLHSTARVMHGPLSPEQETPSSLHCPQPSLVQSSSLLVAQPNPIFS